MPVRLIAKLSAAKNEQQHKRINLLNTKEKINVNLEFYHQQSFNSKYEIKMYLNSHNLQITDFLIYIYCPREQKKRDSQISFFW